MIYSKSVIDIYISQGVLSVPPYVIAKTCYSFLFNLDLENIEVRGDDEPGKKQNDSSGDSAKMSGEMEEEEAEVNFTIEDEPDAHKYFFSARTRQTPKYTRSTTPSKPHGKEQFN